MKISRKDLRELYYLKTEHGYFEPEFIYDRYEIDSKTCVGYYINFSIVKTAQEVYDEWVKNKENPQPTQITQEEQLSQLWDTLNFILKSDGYIPKEVQNES